MFNKKTLAQKTVATLLTVGVLGGALLFATQYVAPSPREEWRSQAASLQQQPVSKYSCLELTEGDTGKYFYRWYESRKGMPQNHENCFMNVKVPEGYMGSRSDSEMEQHRDDVALEKGWDGGVLLYSSSRSRLYQVFSEQTWLTSNERKRSDLSLAASSDFLLYPARVVVSDEGIFEELMGAVDAQRYRR